jgi:hypothetical protein
MLNQILLYNNIDILVNPIELLHKSEFDSRFGYNRVGHRTAVDYESDEAIEEPMLKEGYRKSHYEAFNWE